MERGTQGVLIQLVGNRRAVIEGCDGVVDYDDRQVLLRLGRRTAVIRGQRLRLLRLTGEAAVVEGLLEGVEFGE